MKKGGTAKPWTLEEDEVIETNYPDGGAAACGLPGRTAQAVMQRAFRLGVKTKMNAAHREQDLWPRDRIEKVCDAALRDFRACEPAANRPLSPSLGVAA